MLHNTITLDIESYFDERFSLRRLSIPEYVADPRFHLHGVALRYPDGRCTFAWDMAAAISDLRQTYGDDLERTTVIMHNGHFDGFVLAQRFGLVPRYTLDTYQLACAVFGRRGGPEACGADLSLGALAAQLGLPAKGDLTGMCGVREPDPRQRAALETYAITDVQLTHVVAERLLPQLSRPDVELRLMAHTLRLHNERGLPVDVAAIAPLIADVRTDAEQWFRAAGITPEQAGKSKQFNALLEAALARSGNRKIPLKNGKNGPIPATAKNDAEMQALCEDDDEVVATLARARLARGSSNQLISRLEKLARITTATGSVLPVHLLYHGAHTGRFAGGGGFNVQNLPKGGFGKRIRGLFRAPAGHRLVVADLAQIEARVLATIAGEERLLHAFLTGSDIYSVEASAVFGCPVRKPKDGVDPPELAAQLDGMRQTGKQEVLGLGYGMGALKFLNTLRKDPKCALLFDAGQITPLTAVTTVRRFRHEFSAIPRLWTTLESNVMACVVQGGEGCCGHLRIGAAGDAVVITLPSGRVLRYPQARLADRSGTVTYLDSDGQEAEFESSGDGLAYGPGEGITIYGGKIAENVVQAIARDILAEALLRAEARGACIIAHVHDELIAMAPEDRAEEVLSILREELTRIPAWLPGVPLAVDAHVMERYAK
jgi:DNA polymerase